MQDAATLQTALSYSSEEGGNLSLFSYSFQNCNKRKEISN